MTFRNWVVNPVVRLLLGSPLHRLVSSSLVTLADQGGTTGRWHRLPGRPGHLGNCWTPT